MARGCWPSGTDIPTIPGELFAKFQTSFYADPVDAVFKPKFHLA
jgi:predicted ATP-dependent Lon-type protease